jgi:hypothetical protein
MASCDGVGALGGPSSVSGYAPRRNPCQPLAARIPALWGVAGRGRRHGRQLARVTHDHRSVGAAKRPADDRRVSPPSRIHRCCAKPQEPAKLESVLPLQSPSCATIRRDFHGVLSRTFRVAVRGSSAERRGIRSRTQIEVNADRTGVRVRGQASEQRMRSAQAPNRPDT